MIIMGKGPNSGNILEAIKRKMEGKEDYDKLKEHNDKQHSEPKEDDNSMAYDACCGEIMEAFKSNDQKKLKTALKSMIEMTINEMK